MRCIWTTDEEFRAFSSKIDRLKLQDELLTASAGLFYKEIGSIESEGVEITKHKVEEMVNRVKYFDFVSAFLKDKNVTEIMINGTEKLFVESGIERLEFNLNITEERLNALIQRIVSQVNRSVNLREPIVDARLPDGSRVNIVLKPIALNGPIITIRKFKTEIKDLSSLMALGCFSKEVGQFLGELVRQKKNVFVSGSTSSGKTTLLNCLCQEINENERVITIEDSAELRVASVKNLVSLETRTIKQNDLALISMTALIKSSLRMRPDRIIVGEIRGEEAHDMLQAMNTGHEGSMSTGHANSARDMLRRIETMALSSGLTTSEAIKAQIGSGIDYVVHLARGQDSIRRVVEIIQVTSCEIKGYEIHELFKYSEKTQKKTHEKIVGDAENEEDFSSCTLAH